MTENSNNTLQIGEVLLSSPTKSIEQLIKIYLKLINHPQFKQPEKAEGGASYHG